MEMAEKQMTIESFRMKSAMLAAACAYQDGGNRFDTLYNNPLMAKCTFVPLFNL